MKVSLPLWLGLAGLLSLGSCAARKHTGHPNRPDTELNEGRSGSSRKKRDAIVAYATRFMGTPYVYGGVDPKKGFDCSGFVQYVYRHFEIKVPRTTKEYARFGQQIPLKKARPADLLLFSLYDDYKTIGHIGIVSKVEGARVWFLHAASGRKSGRVMVSELTGVHLRRLKFVTRVLH